MPDPRNMRFAFGTWMEGRTRFEKQTPIMQNMGRVTSRLFGFDDHVGVRSRSSRDMEAILAREI